ncbi:MAG: ATP-binding cassette domain-containing protein, partial [Roseburia porci]|nr:ATP-binding cassette domain-containing protein [Roseburia porci]
MTELELQKIYQRAGNFFLKDINFSMEKGSVTALIGRSGAGKSTLIRLIA